MELKLRSSIREQAQAGVLRDMLLISKMLLRNPQSYSGEKVCAISEWEELFL